MARFARKADIRAAWLRTYETLVTAEMPELAGRMDWDTAIYLYGTGISPETAAARYVKNHKGV
jgi:hypothetical protein